MSFLIFPTQPPLKNPGDGDPLGIFRNRFQGGLDCAVGLVQVVVDDAEVKVVTIGCLYFAALVERPVQLFILRQKTCGFCLYMFLLLSEGLLFDLFSVSTAFCAAPDFKKNLFVLSTYIYKYFLPSVSL